MALRDKIPALLEHIETHFEETIGYQRDLINMLEGDLLRYVQAIMKKELSPKAYERSKGRVPAINVLSRLVDKLSQLYNEPVERVCGENIVDQELLAYYEDMFDIDNSLAFSNRLYNTNKRFALEPYIDNGEPKVRVLPANEFLPYSDNVMNPREMTVFIKFGEIVKTPYLMTKEKIKKSTFYLYSDDEVLKINGEGEVLEIEDNPNDINSYGVIPFVYANSSEIDLIPLKDSDTYTMTTLIPLIFGDLNYATQYLSHSVFYGIDVDVNDLEMNPDSFWVVNSKSGEGKSPSIGTIKPEVDIDKVLNSIKEQLYMWLDSKGIRASGVGDANSASGIAKIIDESDATSARRKQINKFKKIESKLWELIKKVHEIWVRGGELQKERRLFSEDFNVTVQYADLKPMTDTKQELEELKMKKDMGLISKRMALAEANPDLTDEQLDDLQLEIDEEKKANVEKMQSVFKTEKSPVEAE